VRWGLSMAVRGYRTCSRALVLVAVALVVLVAPACGGGDGDDERPSADDLPSSSPTASTSPPTTTVEDAVQEAYEAFVAMADRLITTTVDPDDPELAERLIDPMLSATRTNLTTWQTEGQVWIAGDETHHTVESIEIDGETAYVTSCVVANDVLVESGTVDVEFPEPDAVRHTTTMVSRNGAWLVQYVDVLGRWEASTACGA
jgi:hypothetical protein